MAGRDHEKTTEQGGYRKLFRVDEIHEVTLVDYAYLLSLHPLDLWCASEFRGNPQLSWQELYAKSGAARRMGSAWLLNPRNRRAQDLRLRSGWKETPLRA